MSLWLGHMAGAGNDTIIQQLSRWSEATAAKQTTFDHIQTHGPPALATKDDIAFEDTPSDGSLLIGRRLLLIEQNHVHLVSHVTKPFILAKWTRCFDAPSGTRLL